MSLRSLLHALILSLFLATFCGAGVARAGDDIFCPGVLVQPGQVCYGASHSLTSVRGTNQGSGDGCGGAYNYGQYYCATPTGCHTYTGTLLLTPGIRHRSTTVARYMTGEQTYGSTGAGGSCVAGSPFRVGGPLEDASDDLDAVPVLARAKQQAPAEVAKLVPSADPKAARKFTTSHGDAWVLVDSSSLSVCIVADDNGTGYGVSCQAASDARDSGTIAAFEDGDAKTAAGDTVIALVPDGVDSISIDQADGSSRTVKAVGGVVTTALTGADVSVTLAPSPHAGQGAKATKEMLRGAKVKKHRKK